MNEVHASQTFFDDIAENWDEKFDSEKLQKISLLFREKLPTLNAPVLDLGSGTGILLPILKKYLSQPQSIFEIDISRKMLSEARNKSQHNMETYFVQGDGHILPFKNNFFSTVICFQVFPHFQNKLNVAREIFSALKKNSRLIILHLMGSKQLNEMHKRAGRAVKNDHILNTAEMAILLETVGFRIDHVEEGEDIYLINARKPT